MSEGCIFCRVIARTLPVSVVHEDERTLTIVDLRQSNAGHVLVLPKTHAETLDVLPAGDHAPLMAAIVRAIAAVKRAFAPDGVNVWQSNRPGANQEVPHVHLHVFPRWQGDGHFAVYPGPVRDAPRVELEAIAERLRRAWDAPLPLAAQTKSGH